MKNAVKISAVVITFNEENNIERCLDSVTDVADEVVWVRASVTHRKIVDSVVFDAAERFALLHRRELVGDGFIVAGEVVLCCDVVPVHDVVWVALLGGFPSAM